MSRITKAQLLIFIAISLLYFGTRLYTLETFPHYDNDESFYHQLSLNLKEGKFYRGDNTKWYLDIYGLKYIPIEHPPLHFIITAPFLNEGILSIRITNVILNYIILVLIFFILQKIISTNAGLLGALMWSIYPFAIYVNRWNYPQTSLALFALCFILAMLYNRPYVAMFSMLAATLSQHAGILLIIPFIIKYKEDSTIPLVPFTLFGIGYLMWALDKFLIEQATPTLKRFVLLWPMLLIALSVLVLIFIFRKFLSNISTAPVIKIKRFVSKIPQSFGAFFYFYMLMVYLVIKPIDLYSYYTFGLNIFYIGIIGLFLIKDKTILYSFLVLQFFMIILNRGDHITVMVQPLIIIGFTILTIKSIQSLTIPKLRLTAYMVLTLITIVALAKVYTYIPQDSEDLDSFNKVINYTNAHINNTDCIMTMTKFSTRLNTDCKSDILLPVAFEYDDAVYRHLPDKGIFNYNVSFKNMKYVVVKEQGLRFLQQWGKANNESLFLATNTIMKWENLTVGNITVFINPDTNLTYGAFGEFRAYYRKPGEEGKALAEILSWEETNVSDYTFRENPTK